MLPFAMGASEAPGGNVMTDAFGLVALVAMMPPITGTGHGRHLRAQVERGAEKVAALPYDERARSSSYGRRADGAFFTISLWSPDRDRAGEMAELYQAAGLHLTLTKLGWARPARGAVDYGLDATPKAIVSAVADGEMQKQIFKTRSGGCRSTFRATA